MRRVSVLAALVLLLVGGAGLMTAQKNPAAGRLASFIPRTAGPWLSEADQVYDAESIFQYIDGAGEVFRSYNMKLLVVRRFHKDGRPDLLVELFDMGSSPDAFGVHTHNLDGESAGVGQGSTYKAGLLSFWKDRYFASVSAEEATPEAKEAVLELGQKIAAAIPKAGPAPKILSYLPPEGLDAGRVAYFHNHTILNYHFFVAEKDILLLEGTAEAVLAPYVTVEGKSLLLVVGYPDEDRAGRAYESFSKNYLPDADKGAPVRTEDRKWTASARAGKVVIVVFDAGTDQFAIKQLAGVQELLETSGRDQPDVRPAEIRKEDTES